MNQQKPFRLITIPVSHYCEKVRWALTRMKFNFVEEPHSPPFHLFVTKKLGGKTTPILVTDTEVFTDSTDILKYLNSITLDADKLYPSNPELQQQVEELEELFDSELGTATRRWGYSYISNDYKNIQRSWCQGVPKIQKILYPLSFLSMQKVLQKKFQLTPNSSQEAYGKIKRIFEQVSQLLADGRTYLVGDNFSAADLTFAALAAPIIQPPEHPIKPRSLEELPIKMVSEIKEMRETPAGQFALRLYRQRNI
jgi:glutathione S-transferase